MKSFRPASCHTEKPHHAKGLCAVCYAEQRRESIRQWKVRNRERVRTTQRAYERSLPSEVLAHWRLRKKYGISFADYTALLQGQGGVCAICGKPPKAVRLCVDHCHVTGKVRGLLCRNCNHNLSVFDNKPRFRRILEYLNLTEFLEIVKNG